MDREEMIRMLKVVINYMETKDESPLCARDLRKVIYELERLWKKEDESLLSG